MLFSGFWVFLGFKVVFFQNIVSPQLDFLPADFFSESWALQLLSATASPDLSLP